MLKMVKKSLRRQYLDWLIFVNRMDIVSRRGSGARPPMAPCGGGLRRDQVVRVSLRASGEEIAVSRKTFARSWLPFCL
ncbi:hypothetical protein X989_4979 [Burkholderia pseudomallei MSHR4378]|nr:hypothetical protein X989_4979 [Burkholderia pseudomallei MSHR4378]